MKIESWMKREIGPALFAALPSLGRGDVKIVGNELVFNVPVDELVVSGVIEKLRQNQPVATQTNTFVWMRNNPYAAIQPSKRYGRRTVSMRIGR